MIPELTFQTVDGKTIITGFEEVDFYAIQTNFTWNVVNRLAAQYNLSEVDKLKLLSQRLLSQNEILIKNLVACRGC